MSTVAWDRPEVDAPWTHEQERFLEDLRMIAMLVDCQHRLAGESIWHRVDA